MYILCACLWIPFLFTSVAPIGLVGTFMLHIALGWGEDRERERERKHILHTHIGTHVPASAEVIAS